MSLCVLKEKKIFMVHIYSIYYHFVLQCIISGKCVDSKETDHLFKVTLESFIQLGSTGSFPLLASFLPLRLREGSGQTQEAELIGSTQISMGMCDQSLLPRAFPSLHLLLLLISVCLIVPAHGFPQFPLTS